MITGPSGKRFDGICALINRETKEHHMKTNVAFSHPTLLVRTQMRVGIRLPQNMSGEDRDYWFTISEFYDTHEEACYRLTTTCNVANPSAECAGMSQACAEAARYKGLMDEFIKKFNLV
jgi:hypothetical protein